LHRSRRQRRNPAATNAGPVIQTAASNAGPVIQTTLIEASNAGRVIPTEASNPDSVILTEASNASGGKDLGQLRASEAGTGSEIAKRSLPTPFVHAPDSNKVSVPLKLD